MQSEGIEESMWDPVNPDEAIEAWNPGEGKRILEMITSKGFHSWVKWIGGRHSQVVRPGNYPWSLAKYLL